MANSKKGSKNENESPVETGSTLDKDVAALFALSPAEFTGARNALAARLKRVGRGDEAGRVRALAKPSISAWAVNQLYWKHRKAFDRLLGTVERFRQAQAAQLAGKVSDIRGPLDARREAISDLSHLAAGLLREAGHNPTPDIMRRIATTLEAMSGYTPVADAPPPGQLAADLSPPGFDSLAEMMPGSGMPNRSSQKSTGAAPALGQEATTDDAREREVAAAKVSLQNAERALNEARARAEDAASGLKRAHAEAAEAEKRKREAEERFEKATAASEEAGLRARRAAAEAEEAAKELEGAERAVEKASRELRVSGS